MNDAEKTIIDTKQSIAVGPLYACQLSLKTYINDDNNPLMKREYAKTIYNWLGSLECTIDELCTLSHEKSRFILDVIKKYDIKETDSNLLLNYIDAMGSLEYQLNIFDCRK